MTDTIKRLETILTGTSGAAEQSRKDIRVKYALIQEAIDQAQTTEQMKSALGAANG